LRQASHLRGEYAVTLIGFGDPELEGVDFLPLMRMPKTLPAQGRLAVNLLVRRYGPVWRRFALLRPEETAKRVFDLVLVNDAEPLPLGFVLAKGAPVVFDAHEYYPREFEHSLLWRLLFQPYLIRLCAEHIPRCAGMTTVCPGLAEAYREHFGVLPDVVYNALEYLDLPVNGITPDRIRLIHHGSANPDRRLELMIEAMDHVDGRFSLDLYLLGEGRYIKKLADMAAARNNVALRQPVPMRELTLLSNQYDLGLFLVPPATFNLLFCLPNKFFEFIQARIGVAIGPSPEMAAITRAHDLGIVAGDFTPQALAAALNALRREDIIRFKVNADRAAKIYNAEAGLAVLRRVLITALSGRRA
jgi:hypothetical protein